MTANDMLDDYDASLAPDCSRALEEWLTCDTSPGSSDPASASAKAHIESCESCRELADALRFDQDLLRWQLSRIEPPPAPRLALREPLQAASGHPRRVSLTLLPFLIGVILVLLLAVELMLGSIQNSMSPQIPDRTRTVLQIQKIERAIARHLAPPITAGAALPEQWELALWRAELEASESETNVPRRMRGLQFEDGVFIDPYGVPYRLEVRDAPLSWRVVSAGPDGQFGTPRGALDDLDSSSLSRSRGE